MEKRSGRKFLTSSAIFAALIVAPIIFAIPALLNSRTLLPPGDVGGLLDVHILIGRILSNGQLPLWNPYSQAGIPLIAVAYAGALNPLNLVFAFFSPVAAVNILTIITNQLAMAGCYLFARRIDLSRPAAVIVGVLYALAALNILPAIHIGASATVMTAAWIPWVMLALENLYQSAGWRWVALGSGFLAFQFFAGDVQISLYTFLLSIGHIWYSRIFRKGGAGFLMTAAAMLLCGALLSMIQLLPIRELFLFGEDARLLKELLPFDSAFSGIYPAVIYICALTTLSVAMVSYTRHFSPSFWLWVSVSAISMAIGLLPTQLHEPMSGWVPVYGLFPNPAGHLYICAFATAILCGFAFNGLSKINLKIDYHSNPYRLTFASAGGLVVLAPVFGILWLSSNGVRASYIDSRLDAPDFAKFIVSRDKGVGGFRAINLVGAADNANYSPAPDGQNSPVVSPAAHRLRIINSPEQILLPGLSAIAGDLRRGGAIEDRNLLMSYHQGLNLLNVKYLLLTEKEPDQVEQPANPLNIDEVMFNRDKLGVTLRQGNRINIPTEAGITASELALVSNMSFSEQVENDTVVCVVKLHTKKDGVLIREMRAGKDTAEWSHDKPEILSVIRHGKARIAASGPAGDFVGHEYISTLKFDRAEIGNIEFEYINPRSQLSIIHLSLHDPESGKSVPITSRNLINDKWRKVERFKRVTVYENRAALSRAWFVKRVEAFSLSEMPEIIKSGVMPDGTLFDPGETALVDQVEFDRNGAKPPVISGREGATVTVDYSDTNGIKLTAQNSNPGYLVLSEPFFRGWDAFVDGKRTPVNRVNYILQGIPIGAGRHEVEFKYRSPAARNGASYSLLGVLILIAGVFVGARGAGKIYSLVPVAAPFINLVNSSAEYLQLLYGKYRKLITGPFLSGLFVLSTIAGIAYYSYLMVRYAIKVVTGNDSYGYASLAKYISQLKVVQPIVELSQFDLPPEFADVFIPITYISGAQPGTMVPQYPPGHPMLIAAFSLLFGWEIGPFIIGPISAIASSALTYLVARELGLSRRLSTAAGFMLALSPIVVFMGIQIVSDGASMMLDLVVVYASLACRRKIKWAWVAGIFFGLAVLVRPTNAFMIIPVIFCLPLNVRGITYFALGGLPSAVFLYIYNLSVYGNPFQASYGQSIFNLFDLSFSFISTRFRHYTYWVAMFMSPLILAGWLGTIINHKLSLRIRAMLVSWFGVFLMLYCLYSFYSDWWFTRFLMPGWPALIIGSLITAEYIGQNLRDYVNTKNYALASRMPLLILVAIVVTFSVYNIRKLSMFDYHAGAKKEKDVVIWANDKIPRNALVVSGYYSGLLKYYDGLSIVRFIEINETRWNLLKEKVKSKGCSIYALLTPFEVELAQKNMPAKWSMLGSYEGQMLWRVETE